MLLGKECLKLSRSKVFTAEDKKLRLPWWGVLCVIMGTILVGLPFAYFKRFDLAFPSLISGAMLTLAIVMRWRLSKKPWFWMTIVLLAAIHVPLVLFLPWTTKWIPAFVIAPLGIADLYGMLWIIEVLDHRRNTDVPG
jgi:peptidoglycan/LPS O-acetylase OafA/YrhL